MVVWPPYLYNEKFCIGKTVSLYLTSCQVNEITIKNVFACIWDLYDYMLQ